MRNNFVKAFFFFVIPVGKKKLRLIYTNFEDHLRPQKSPRGSSTALWQLQIRGKVTEQRPQPNFEGLGKKAEGMISGLLV